MPTYYSFEREVTVGDYANCDEVFYTSRDAEELIEARQEIERLTAEVTGLKQVIFDYIAVEQNTHAAKFEMLRLAERDSGRPTPRFADCGGCGSPDCPDCYPGDGQLQKGDTP